MSAIQEITPTTETRRHGENRDIGSSGHRCIGISGHRKFGHILASCRPERQGVLSREASANGRIYALVSGAYHVLKAALREIFDESAYERFLERTQSARSVVSYREFLREREAAVARKPRCC